MLGALYLVGAPVFGFLAWVFSEAVHVGQADDRRSRRLFSVLAGALWPLMLVGLAQLLSVWILVRFSQARRLAPADRGLLSDTQAAPVSRASFDV